MTGQTAAALLERVWALDSFGRHDQAIAEARSGLAEFPDDPDLNGSLAWLEFFHGDRDRAEAAARQAIAARPDDWRGLNILVEIAVVRGNSAEAEATARTLVGLLPNWEGSHLALAYALEQSTGGGRRARKLRRETIHECVADAVALAPEHVETLRRGAVLLHRSGASDEAAELVRRALVLAPDDEQLRLLTLEVDPKSELEGVRLLTGVLAQNPQQRAVARTLSDAVWFRTQLLPAMVTFFLAAMMIFAYLVFGDEISLSHRATRNLAYAFLALPIAWFMLFVGLGRAFPPRYLRRLWRPVWWVWIAFAIAAPAGLVAMFLGLAFAIRSQPTQLEMNGPYVAGLTIAIGFVAVFVLLAELGIVFARFHSEQRNRLFAGDAEGRAAARAELAGALRGLIRTVLAGVLALLPVVAAGIATRPEAASGCAAVAVALGTPPLVRLALCVGRVRSLSNGATWPWTAGALVLAVAALAVAWGCAVQHAGEFDPPPTPWELEMREWQRGIGDTLGELDGLSDIDHEQLRQDLDRSSAELQQRLQQVREESGVDWE